MPPTFTSAEGTPALDAETYRFLRDYIHRESGILLDDDKHYLLEARLVPVIQQTQLASLAALCGALRDYNPPLRKKVVEAMTTHETLFFRDIAPFDGMRSEILPKLIEKRKSARCLNIWSAASSSGQEAYSLAMLILRNGDNRLEHPDSGDRPLRADPGAGARRPLHAVGSESRPAGGAPGQVFRARRAGLAH